MQVVSQGEARTLGSGHQVNGDTVITAEHVVRGAQRLTVRFVVDADLVREVDAEAIWADASLDLAVVRLSM